METQPFSRIPRKPLTAEVYERLKQAILSGAIPAGERLLEAHIAQGMQVSRAPVREALRMLQADRLVEFQVGQGARVRLPADDELWEIYTARCVLEGFAASLAARRARPGDLERLREALAGALEVAAQGDLQATLAADFAFHRLVWEISGHRLLRELLDRLEVQVRMFMAVQAPLFGHLPDSVRSHAEILEAITAGDPLAASRAIQQHIIEAGLLSLRAGATHEEPDASLLELDPRLLER